MILSRDPVELVVTADCSIHEAVMQIEKNGCQSVAVVDSQMKLLGILTDGDVRRGLISRTDLNNSVSSLMRTKPIVALDTLKKTERLRLMRRHAISALPIVNKEGRLVDLCKISDFTDKLVNDARVVIMAGGKGLRLGELTKNTPKPMLNVWGKPVLEMLLEKLIRHGFYKFSISVNYLAEQIIDYFGDGKKYGVEIDYLQESTPLGTAGSLSLIKGVQRNPLLVMNADLITEANFFDILNFHNSQKSIATVCVTKITTNVPFGVIVEREGFFHEATEKPSFEHTIYAGICVLSPEALKYVSENTFFDMPELFKLLLKKQQPPRIYQLNGYWIDIGRKDDLKKAEYLNNKIRE
ncbi:nucleotidyltransferase family protein [Alphaproteobacteria bacterium]|nr:nucleotidyltransferase family protein [Alphaproteobacteria bacterium]